MGRARRRGRGSGDTVFVKNIKQDANVFQAGVHTLSVEGDHGMRRVAKDDGRVSKMVWVAFDGDEGEMGI